MRSELPFTNRAKASILTGPQGTEVLGVVDKLLERQGFLGELYAKLTQPTGTFLNAFRISSSVNAPSSLLRSARLSTGRAGQSPAQ